MKRAWPSLGICVVASAVLAACSNDDSGSSADAGLPVGGTPAPVGGEPAPVGGEPAPVGGDPGPGGPTQQEVAAIFSVACNGCHIGGTSGGLSLAGDFTTTTVNVRSSQSALDLIEPGDRAASYLFRKLEGTHIEAGGRSSRMPLGGSLTVDEIETVGLWIDLL